MVSSRYTITYLSARNQYTQSNCSIFIAYILQNQLLLNSICFQSLYIMP
jgi:hypothetical protein